MSSHYFQKGVTEMTFKAKIDKFTADMSNRRGRIVLTKAYDRIELDLNGYKLIKIPESCIVKVPRRSLK